MRGFKNFKGSDARCPSIHFLFYDPWHQISSNKVLLCRRFKHFVVFLIDDLTTIEYLKLMLPVYLVHSKVHERYKFFDYQKRQNKNSAFRAKALQYYDRRIQ